MLSPIHYPLTKRDRSRALFALTFQKRKFIMDRG